MLRYNDFAKHTFLSPEWCNKLRDTGIDMSDAVYYLKTIDGAIYVTDLEEITEDEKKRLTPTYTLPDLLYKLDEFPYVDDVGCPLEFFKDAPFYGFGYYFDKRRNTLVQEDKLPTFSDGKHRIAVYRETPLEGAALLLLTCAKEGVKYNRNISGKYRPECYD